LSSIFLAYYISFRENSTTSCWQKKMWKFCILLILVFTLFTHQTAVASTTDEIFHICEAGDPRFLGQYVGSKEQIDNVALYYNDKDMALYRNNGFWYLGNLIPWPPETHYRCVSESGCNYRQDKPPSTRDGKWTAAAKFGIEPPPVITLEPCSSGKAASTLANEEL